MRCRGYAPLPPRCRRFDTPADGIAISRSHLRHYYDADVIIDILIDGDIITYERCYALMILIRAYRLR